MKIIELNGVTFGSQHIYDPKLSLFDPIVCYLKQWRIAFEIGNLNVRGACDQLL